MLQKLNQAEANVQIGDQSPAALSGEPTVAQIGRAFPFVARDGEVSKIKDMLQHRLAQFKKRDPQSVDVLKEVRTLVCFGPCGAGKSRFASELLSALQEGSEQNVKLALQHNFHVSVTLGSVLKLYEKGMDLFKAIMLSCIFNHAQRMGQYTQMVSIDFVKSCMKVKSLWSFDAFRKLIMPEKDAIVLLHLDEVHARNQDEEAQIKDCVDFFHRFSWEASTEQNILLIPLLTGTSAIAISQISGSRRHQIDLPPLTGEHYWEIIKSLCNICVKPPRGIDLLLDSICFCPRLLQVLLSVLYLAGTHCMVALSILISFLLIYSFF